MGYLDDTAVPRVNPTKVYMTAGKRCHMPFHNCEVAVVVTSQMTFDALRT